MKPLLHKFTCQKGQAQLSFWTTEHHTVLLGLFLIISQTGQIFKASPAKGGIPTSAWPGVSVPGQGALVPSRIRDSVPPARIAPPPPAEQTCPQPSLRPRVLAVKPQSRAVRARLGPSIRKDAPTAPSLVLWGTLQAAGSQLPRNLPAGNLRSMGPRLGARKGVSEVQRPASMAPLAGWPGPPLSHLGGWRMLPGQALGVHGLEDLAAGRSVGTHKNMAVVARTPSCPAGGV